MVTIVYRGHMANEINEHWIKQNVPQMLHKLSIEAFALNNLESALQALDGPNDASVAKETRRVVQKTHYSVRYLLFCFDKLSVMVA